MNDQEPTMSDDEVLRRVRILRGATNRRAVLKLADRLETVIAERDAAVALMVDGMIGVGKGTAWEREHTREWIQKRIAERVALEAGRADKEQGT